MIGAFRNRLSAVHVNHKRIAVGAALIGALTIIAKLFVAAREMAIAWRFGVSGLVDSYQLALTITTWLPMMLTSVMTVVLVPRLIVLRQRADEYRSFIAELNGTVIVLGIAVTLLTFVTAPAVSAFLASSANRKTLELTSSISQLMAPVALFSICIGYMSTRLQSRERFAYSVTEAVPAMTIALFTALALGIAGQRTLVMGTLIGFALQLVVLVFLVRQDDPPVGSIRFKHRSAAWSSVYGALTLMAFGQMLIMTSLPIDQGFAARLGRGSVATLGYSNRIITLFSGIATLVVGRALLPVLSGAVARGEDALARRQALQWSIILFVAGTVVVALFWFIVPVFVRLLFQRGAFTAAASREVAIVLRWGLLQLPPYFAGIALVQWFAATGRFRAILRIAATALLLKIALNATLAPRYGVSGIIIATGLMYFWTCALLVLGTLGAKRRAVDG